MVYKYITCEVSVWDVMPCCWLSKKNRDLNNTAAKAWNIYLWQVLYSLSI